MTNKFLTQRILPGPAWLHFLLLGAALHFLLVSLFPPPPPVIGPPNIGRLQLLYDGYARMAGEQPNAAQIERFIDKELREEMLFREAIEAELFLDDPAVVQRLIRNILFLFPDNSWSDTERVERGLALNMHLTDEVVRRRLVQMMEQLLIASQNVQPPTHEELLAFFDAKHDEFIAPARVSFEHVFLGNMEAREVEAIYAQVVNEKLSPKQALSLGTAFLEGYRFDEFRWRDIEGRFGSAFSKALEERVGIDQLGWVGIVPSVFGTHLVFVSEYRPAYPQPFEEVSDDIRWQVTTERDQAALDKAIDALMNNYEVRRS